MKPSWYVRRVSNKGHVHHGQKMFRHATSESAFTEASRLAGLFPGKKFVVLAEVGDVVCQPVQIDALTPGQVIS